MKTAALLFLLAVLCLLLAPAVHSEEDVVTFTREQIAKLYDDVEQIIQKREEAAFEAGKRHQAQACRSLL